MSLEAAYIVPHPPLAIPEVGGGEERGIAATLAGYREVANRISAIAPDDIVIISPHTAYYPDWIFMAGGDSACGDLAQFRVPQVDICLDYDVELRERIEGFARKFGVPAGAVGDAKELDHGILVPLYFLQQAYPSTFYRAVSIGGSALPREKLLEFGRCIADGCEAVRRSCVLLVSGDLSHKLKDDGPYGFDPAGPVFDEEFERIVRAGDPFEFAQMDAQMCEDAAECGLSGFIMMAGALRRAEEISGKPFSSELISHEGPFGVGYGVAAFESPSAVCLSEDLKLDMQDDPLPKKQTDDPLVSLAARTIDGYVRTGSIPDAPELPSDVPERAGCFVSIHTSDGDLRGCIGTIDPVQQSLAEEIIANAIAASTRDPRFEPIKPAELDGLRINVDVLFPPEPATLDVMDPVRYGIIVTQGWRRGLLLPDLEGVDTVEDQFRIACMKAGLSPDTNPSEVDIERFEVVRHE